MKTLWRALTFAILLAFLFSGWRAVTATPPAWQGKVDPWVLETAAQGETEFLIYLKEQADLSGARRLATKSEKGAYVFAQLTRTAQETQGPILQALRAQGVEHRPYWVANMIWARGGTGVVQAMAQRADVAHLYANPHVKLDGPTPSLQEPSADQPAAPDTVEWNIAKARAPEVWAQGYTGQGAVVGGQDTGYAWQHPALMSKYRGWDGFSANHNYNWHDAIHADDTHTLPGNPCGFNLLEPCDDGRHGTHTMGTMVGDDGTGNQIGMAPGARWIGCRNMEQGWGTPASYSECYEWFIAPTDLNNLNPRPDLAPDVINNSWSCPPDEGCEIDEPNVLLTVVENVRAAGILTVHAAGNSGGECGTVSTPAAIYDASFTVGNTDRNDMIYINSSRGSVTVDGSNRLKPDVSAPGTDIRSSVPEYPYYQELDGTSMSAPHVAGLVALLISAEPSLAGQVEAIESIITHSAVPRTTNQLCGGIPGSQVPNNTYGWGRVDAWNAWNWLIPQSILLDKDTSSSLYWPGQVITYTLTLTNPHLLFSTYNVVLTDTIPANTTFITATLPHTLTCDTIEWGFPVMAAGEKRSVELVVQASSTFLGTLVNEQYGVRSDEAPYIQGWPVYTLFASAFLPLMFR